MLKIYLLIFVLFIFKSVFGQGNKKETITYKGIILDSSSRDAIPYATVILIRSSKHTKVVIADQKGEFEFQIPDSLNQIFELSAVGYLTLHYPLTIENKSMILHEFLLSKSEYQLKEVKVYGTKPILSREIDRIVYNVQADPEKNILSVSDILRKMPLITINGNSILLNGSSNYKVLIDGKPSSIFSGNPSEAAKGIAADGLLKIELITTPPAKYDGAGLAGIINIVSVKSGPQGFKGKISIKGVVPDGPAGFGSFSIKDSKMGISSYGGLVQLTSPQTNSNLFRDSKTITLIQHGMVNSKNYFSYGHIESSYEIDSLNLLTLTVNYSGHSGLNNTNQISILKQKNTLKDYNYNLLLDEKNSSAALDVGLNYELAFNKNRTKILTNSYRGLLNREKTKSISTINDSFNYPRGIHPNLQKNPSGSTEHTFQADFISIGNDLTVEGGTKVILRKNFSNYSYGNLINFIENYLESSDFNYNQHIYAAYNSYSLDYKKYKIKAGLRIENTLIRFNTGKDFSGNYLNFIPSVSLMKEFGENNSIIIGYTNRIERPGITELNPFIDKSDARTLTTGNPNLNVSSSNNIEVSYNYLNKVSINSGITYATMVNGIDIVTFYNPNTNEYISTYQNAINLKRLGYNLSLSIPLTETFNINTNAAAAYNWISGQVGEGKFQNNAFTYNIYSTATKKLQNNFNLSVSGNYNTGIILLQGRTNSVLFYSASISKTSLNKKFIFSAALNNPFRTYRNYAYQINTANSIQVLNNQIYFRQISASVSYSFGKLKSSIKLNERGIINDDLKEQ